MSKTPSAAVLVSSCDRYSDLWSPFFALWFRYWPDCPYPVYLQSNHRRYDDRRVHAVTVGDDINWSRGFRDALAQIPERYLIVLMEDYFLERPVDTRRVVALVDLAAREQVGCLRLFPCPGPDAPWRDNAGKEHAGIGEIAVGAPYRCSLQAAIWDKQGLDSLLVDGESAWDLEISGSRRADRAERPFLSVEVDAEARYPIPYFCTAVEKGRWLRPALDLCRREGVAVDLGARPTETRRSAWSRRFRQWRGR